MNPAIINGTLCEGGSARIGLNDRAFHYGDGVFETIRLVNGKPLFLDAHWARLAEGLRVLRIHTPKDLSRGSLEEQLMELSKAAVATSARCRLSAYRETGGYYAPKERSGRYTIEIQTLPHANYRLDHEGLVVDIYPDLRKPVNALSVHKTMNGLYYIMAGLWSQERNLGDCLLQNDRGNIIESSRGNIFIVSNGVLYTPSLSDGCVGGIMRMQIVNLALANNIKVYECSLTPQNLLTADELFITNAISGITWCGSYRTKRYLHRMSQHLTQLLAASVS
jgi:aminodeoxychorismate lyase